MDENSLKDYLSQMGELIEQCDRLRLENEDLRKRLEWQPMETATNDLVLLKTHGGIRLIGTVRSDNLVSSVYELAPVHEYAGWMPLPEVE